MKRYLIALLLLASFNSYAGLHKWVDADGKVHYSDEPPAGNVKEEAVRLKSSSESPASAPPERKTIFEQEADIKKEQKAKEEAAKKAAKQQEEAQTKQKNCELSRTQLYTLQNSPRITTYNASGEQTTMDDAARQRSTDEAQANVSKYCN